MTPVNSNRNNKTHSRELYEVLPFSMFSHSDIPLSYSDIGSNGHRERRRHDREDERSCPNDKRSSQWQRSDNPGSKHGELDWSAAVSSFVQLLLAFINLLCFTKDILLKALSMIFFSYDKHPAHSQKTLEDSASPRKRDSCKRVKSMNYTNDFDITDTESMKTYTGKMENMRQPHLRNSDVFSDRPSGTKQSGDNLKPKEENKIYDTPSHPCYSVNDVRKTTKDNCFSQNCSGVVTGMKHLESFNTHSDSSTQTKYFTGLLLPGEPEGRMKDSSDCNAYKNFKTTTTSELFPERSDSLLAKSVSSQLREGVIDFLTLKSSDLHQTLADGNRSGTVQVASAERIGYPQFGPQSNVDPMTQNHQPRYEQSIPHDMFRYGHAPQIYQPSYDPGLHIYQPRHDHGPQIYQSRYDPAPHIYQPGTNHLPQSYQIPQIDQFGFGNTPQSYQPRLEQLPPNYQSGFNQMLPSPQPIYILPRQQYRFIQTPPAQGSDPVVPVEQTKQKKKARLIASCKSSAKNSKSKNSKVNAARKSLSFRRNSVTESSLNLLSPARKSSKKASKPRRYPDLFKFIEKYPSSGASTVNNSCDCGQHSESSSSSTKTESDERPSVESRPSFSEERTKRVTSIPLFPHLRTKMSSKALQTKHSGRVSSGDVDESALLSPNSKAKRFKNPSSHVSKKSPDSGFLGTMFQSDGIDHKDYTAFCNHSQKMTSFKKQNAKMEAGVRQLRQNQMKESVKPLHTSKHKKLKKQGQMSNSFACEQPRKPSEMTPLRHNMSFNSPSLLTRWREIKSNRQASMKEKPPSRVSIDGISGQGSYPRVIRCDFSPKLSDIAEADFLQMRQEIYRSHRQDSAQSPKIYDHFRYESQELDEKDKMDSTLPKFILGVLKP